MAESDDVNVSDIMKMKVAELKRELKARGLSTVGNKTELIERLQGVGDDSGSATAIRSTGESDGAAVDADVIDETGNHEDSELLDEDDVLEDGLDDELSVEGISETNDSSGGIVSTHSGTIDTLNVASEQPVKPMKRKQMASSKKTESTGQPPKKITLNRNTPVVTAASEKENQDLVIQDKSNSSVESKETNGSPSSKKVVKLSSFSVKERLELRAQKFGTTVSDAAKREARAVRFGLASGQTSPSSSVPVASAEVLKKRAERFGTAVSPILKKTELEEKLKLRQQRFGVVTAGNSTNLSVQTNSNLDEKKRLRAERFKITAT